jgi:nitric oxide reductase NorD protein
MHDDFKSFFKKMNDISPKAARAFQTVGEELLQELSSEQFQTWFNLGTLISYASSSNGIKFFNESSGIIRKIAAHPSFIPVLQTGIQLTFAQNSMALDYFRTIPDLIDRFPPSVIAQWAETGKPIAEQDYLTGSEYFKAGPSILPILDLTLLEPWGKIGILLSKEDLQSKTFSTLEYFRTSPDIFSQVKAHSLFPQILKIGHALALQTPKETTGYFKAIPAIFQNLHQDEETHLIFSLATELAFQAPVAVIDFLAHATDLLKMMNGNFTSLRRFVETGIQIKGNPELVKSFFALKSKKSIETVQELSNTVFLSEIMKRLTFYAEMATGLQVEIHQGILPSSGVKNHIGRINLPEKINVYQERENNFKLYKMMTLHEAAHIEFGSYEPLASPLLEELSALFPGEKSAKTPGQPVWRYFPDPVFAQNLWTIAEESRIDYLLRSEYPGAIRDLKPIFLSQKANRPDLFNLPEEKAILEALFQLSIHEDIVVPLPIANTVSRIFTILKMLWRPGCTITDTFHTVCLMYQELQKVSKPAPPGKETPDVISPEENILNYGTIPQSAFSHHGLITPDLSFQTESAPMDHSFNLNVTENQQRGESQGESLNFRAPEEGADDSNQTKKTGADTGFYYDEWDWMSQDYKPGWCRVVERIVEPSLSSFTAIEPSFGSLLSIRRYFERLRPENYKKAKKEKDGDEFDFDRLIDLVVDIRAGTTPPENFYIRREKKERKVSLGLLIDLSGSTRQTLSKTGKRIIDLEKESLILMAEALNTLGDEYGIFGFSGQSREEIEFHTIKHFDEKLSVSFRSKVAALEPQKQNRDGAAIRHLTQKMEHREAKIKLLMIISDGKPLDDDYKELYALEDTKMALREARQKRVHPFCITVDREASDYIEKMYQEVNYTFISDIETLPMKLPLIYQKLTT